MPNIQPKLTGKPRLPSLWQTRIWDNFAILWALWNAQFSVPNKVLGFHLFKMLWTYKYLVGELVLSTSLIVSVIEKRPGKSKCSSVNTWENIFVQNWNCSIFSTEMNSVPLKFQYTQNVWYHLEIDSLQCN